MTDSNPQLPMFSFSTTPSSVDSLSSLYSSIEKRIDTLENKIKVTQTYIDRMTKADQRQDISMNETEQAYLVQLPQAVLMATLAGLLSSLLNSGISQLAVLAQCDSGNTSGVYKVLTFWTFVNRYQGLASDIAPVYKYLRLILHIKQLFEFYCNFILLQGLQTV